jgi:hypothetical protein
MPVMTKNQRLEGLKTENDTRIKSSSNNRHDHAQTQPSNKWVNSIQMSGEAQRGRGHDAAMKLSHPRRGCQIAHKVVLLSLSNYTDARSQFTDEANRVRQQCS